MRQVHLTTKLESRFWAKVDKRDPDDCWLWIARVNASGYGTFKVDNSSLLAHRVSYVIHHKVDLGDICVLHNCPGGDNPACVNPAHLWLGTTTDNNRDRDAKQRVARGEMRATKLTEQDVIDIRLRAAAGEMKKLLALEYGVNDGYITHIVKRHKWTHIP